MKELTIRHIPAKGRPGARVSVSYRAHERAQPRTAEAPFHFEITAEQRRLIQWYLEEYLLYPWGDFNTRAQGSKPCSTTSAESSSRPSSRPRVLGRCTATSPTTWSTLAASSTLRPLTRPASGCPGKLLRDPDREYGHLATLARAFVRGQPDLTWELPARDPGDTFNMLLIICRPTCEDGHEDAIAFQSEARPLLELFRPHRDKIRVDVLRPPTLEFAITLLRHEETNLIQALRVTRRYDEWSTLAYILFGLRRPMTTLGRRVEWEHLLVQPGRSSSRDQATSGLPW